MNRIGVATVDITPPVGVTMVGYKPRQATSVGHPLRAEALACRAVDDTSGWVLVASDTIGYPRAFADRVRGDVAGRLGCPVSAVMLTATHTHSGPPTIQFGRPALSALDTEVLETLADRLVEVAVRAWQDAEPAVLEVAWARAGELMSNRRIQGPDGVWINEWQDPEGQHPGCVDPDVLLVGVRRQDRLVALLVNPACHPVVLGPQSLAVSPDYAGYLKAALEREAVADTVLFCLAGGANINPRSCILEGAEHPRRMGEAMAEKIAAAIPELRALAEGPPCSHEEPWHIQRTRNLDEKGFLDGDRSGAIIETSLQTLRAGDFGALAIPGELFCEYNTPFRESSPCAAPVVASLANDYVGYLPTDEAQREGAYEPRLAPAEALEEDLLRHAAAAWEGVE